MALFNSFTFDGENSLDNGIYISGEAAYNAPERAVEMITVPGRNGAIAMDQGRFENIEVTYHCGCFASDEEGFADKIAEFRNILASKYTYKRLTDTYNPDEFRMALYKSGLEVEPTVHNRAGEFDITFDCKPQRFLTSGEVPVTADDWSDVQTGSGSLVTIDNDGSLAVKSLEVALEPIQDLNGYSNPWVGGAGKNKLVLMADDIKAVNTAGTWSDNVYSVSGMTYTLNSDSYGHIVSVTINGTTTTYPTFRIPINGLTVGQSYKLYRGSFRSRLIKDDETVNDGSSDYTFTAESGDYWVVIFTGASTVSNVTVQPMVCLASDTSTFEPYENICPISGWDSVDVTRTGKNLCDGTFANGYHTNTGVWVSTNGNRTAIIKVKPSTKYTTSIYDGSGTRLNHLVTTQFDENMSFITDGWKTDQTITTTPNTVWLAVRNFAGQSSYITSNNFLYQLEEGDTYSAFSEYGTTYTVSLSSAGTVYGGTLDVVSGVLTVDRAMVTFDGSESNWQETTGSGFRQYFITVSGMKNSQNAICDSFQGIALSERSSKTGMVLYTDTSIRLSLLNAFCTDNEITNLNTWKTWLQSNNVQVVYELATPQTYQLTAQQIDMLTGTNNIWSDSGDVTVEYGTSPFRNPTEFSAKPLIKTVGTGTIRINGVTIAISESPTTIDCEAMEAYNGTTSRNGDIVLTPNVFPTLEPGANVVEAGSGITTLEITPRWWRI